MSGAAVAAIIAYLIYSYIAIVFIGNRPVLMPKSAYRYFCRFGNRIRLADDIARFNYLFEFEFGDHFYRNWRDDVLARGWIADSEILALGSKTVYEMEVEIKRRKSIGNF